MNKSLTEAQKKKLIEARNKTIKSSVIMGLKYSGLLFLGNLFISFVAIILNLPTAFSFTSGVVGGFLVIRSWIRAVIEQEKALEAEIKKIVKGNIAE